jgi:hypothetical protein
MRLAGLASVAVALLLVSGCAKHPIEIEVAPPSDARGPIATRPGKIGVVVAAPGPAVDGRTGEIAEQIARRTGFGLVVATGASLSAAEYEQRVRDAARGPLTFFVEIRSNARNENAARIEIATVGVDRDRAFQLKTLLELTRDAHLRGHADAPRLDVLVEPADRLVSVASAAKRDGIFRLPERALAIELPRAARREFAEIYTTILADFLAQAVNLKPLR